MGRAERYELVCRANTEASKRATNAFGYHAAADFGIEWEAIRTEWAITDADIDAWKDEHYRRLREAHGYHERASLSPEVRMRIYQRDHGTCVYCGVSLSAAEFHVDHRLPLARGGSNDEANLCATCPNCNLRKHTMTAEEFAAQEVVL